MTHSSTTTLYSESNPGDANVFDRISRLVDAGDLMTPLGPSLNEGLSIQDAVQLLEEQALQDRYDPAGRVSLVFRNDQVAGYVALDELLLCERREVFQASSVLNPGQIITRNLSAFEAAEHICTTPHPFVFVLDGKHYAGSLAYRDLFASPFRLCLFALTLELEEAAISALLRSATQAFSSLSAGRRAKARDICRMRYGGIPHFSDSLLIKSTTFIDKSSMLTKTAAIPHFTKGEVRTLFKEAERVRNFCAHPEGDGRVSCVMEKQKLLGFIGGALKLKRALSQGGIE